MNETIYGFLHHTASASYAPRIIIEQLLAQKAAGIFVLDSDVSDETVRLAEQCKKADLEVVLGLRWPNSQRRISGNTNAVTPDDIIVLHRARQITRKLALGNTKIGEWRGCCRKHRDMGLGKRLAKFYKAIATDYDFEWSCSITADTIWRDIGFGHTLKPLLKDTRCFCLSGPVLMGYCHGDPRLPGQANDMAMGQRLYQRYGLRAASLREWLRDMDCVTGAGGQDGLDAGSRQYASALGFSGLVVGMPFDLTGSQQHRGFPEMDKPPMWCGWFGADYNILETA